MNRNQSSRLLPALQPARSPPVPLDDAATKLTMQRLIDYFDFYWRGQVSEWKRQDQSGDRETAYKNMIVPRKRQSARDQNAQPLGAPALDPNMTRTRYGAAVNNTRNNAWKTEVQTGASGIINFTKPLELRLSKVLGKGGQGIACLFRLTLPDGSKDALVIKASIKSDEISREVANLALMTGAEHIVQRRYMRNITFAQPPAPQAAAADVVPADDAGPSITAGPVPGGTKRPADDELLIPRSSKIAKQGGDKAAQARLFDSQRNLYAMEYMRHGDVWDLINRYALENKKFTNEDLWEVFNCMYRGCVAMAYPNSWSGGLNPENQDVPTRWEGVPRDPATRKALNHRFSLIHFDLDVQNTMVGTFNTNHPQTPVFKIGDLGLAEWFQDTDRADYRYMMGRRKTGKSSIYTPEQTTKDWDYLNASPHPNEPVAGNFDFWTNLYQVALIMWQMVTLLRSDNPPQCSKNNFAISENINRSIWNYGGFLLANRPEAQVHQDELLRTVARCMAHNPADRISIEELEDIFFRQVYTDNAWPEDGEADIDERAYMRDVITRPPPPPPAIATEPTAALADAVIQAAE